MASLTGQSLIAPFAVVLGYVGFAEAPAHTEREVATESVSRIVSFSMRDIETEQPRIWSRKQRRKFEPNRHRRP